MEKVPSPINCWSSASRWRDSATRSWSSGQITRRRLRWISPKKSSPLRSICRSS